MLQPTPASLDSHIRKYERAKEHFEAMRSEVVAFLKPSRPCDLVVQFDGESHEYVVRAQVLRQPPIRLSLIVGDCLHNARSALDHLVWQLIFKHSGKDATRCEFPIFCDRDDYLLGPLQPAQGKAASHRRNPGGRKITGVDPRVKAIIERLQPYNRTDGPADLHPLYLLHNLDNRDKHRVLNLAITTVRPQGLNLSNLVNVRHRVLSQATGALEDGTEFARFKLERADDAIPGKVYLNTNLESEITFDKEGPGRGLPVADVLDGIMQSVSDVFVALEPFW